MRAENIILLLKNKHYKYNLKGMKKMKVKFTQEDLDAIETAYYDNEGRIPCDLDYTPEDKTYQILQQLWLRMAARIEKEDNERNEF